MGQDKVVDIFMEHPARAFHMREISRITGIPKTSVGYSLSRLIKTGLVAKEKKDVFASYRANAQDKRYRFSKKLHSLTKIFDSGLVQHIEEILAPSSIFLFGSFAKAEYSQESDIDIFVQCARKDIDLKAYEKKLGHNISLFFEPYPERLSSQIFNNIINGVKLSGFLKAR